jgi:hypothetical protein
MPRIETYKILLRTFSILKDILYLIITVLNYDNKIKRNKYIRIMFLKITYQCIIMQRLAVLILHTLAILLIPGNM